MTQCCTVCGCFPQFPSLCHSYMRLVAYITEVHPAKVCELPHPLLKALMESVEIALSSYPCVLMKASQNTLKMPLGLHFSLSHFK